MSLRSHLARVRGLGSAKAGTAHWWSQRLTAIALVPLVVWFVVSLIGMAGADHEAARSWIGSPMVAGLLIFLIVATFYHAYLGLQVVIEDYVHKEACKIAGLLLVKAACLVLTMIGVLSVLSILFKG